MIWTVDGVPNPQDPDNERSAEMLEVEEGDDLDDSDRLEKGAAASNIMELPCISKDLSKKQREELLNQNPALRTLLSDLLDDKLKEVIHGGMVTVSRNAGKTVSKRPIGNRVKVQKPARIGKGVSIIKSPSDTTIYTPALKLQNQSLETVKTGKAGEIRQEVLDVGIVNTEQPVQDNITQFLQTMRLESSKGKPMYCDNTDVLFSGVAGDEPEQGTRNENVLPSTSRNVQNTTDVIDQAKDRADKTVLEAEKFQATIVDPPGMISSQNFEMLNLCTQPEQQSHSPGISGQNIPIVGNLRSDESNMACRTINQCPLQGNLGQTAMMDIGKGVSDDDFFHLTCHIEPNLIHKIEKGEFVELEKLLPKDRLGGYKGHEENRLEWVQRDGGTYLVPASRDSKINSIRRWEQAFHAYATIYSGANPHRAKEIWQYISVINTAAASYAWDNVYNYDITFRHLIAFNPHRSWAITYNQMWNLSMKDPLPRNQQKFGSMNSNQHHNSGSKGFGGDSGCCCLNQAF